nr:hypothetical protein CKG001_14700 [Bdellovibrio sp. CKG001]
MRDSTEKWLQQEDFIASGIGTNNKINLAIKDKRNQQYFIYRQDSDSATMTRIGVTSESNFADTNIQENHDYYYHISKIDLGLDIVTQASRGTAARYTPCFSRERISALKQLKNLDVLTSELRSFYSECKSEIKTEIEGGLSENETAAVFSLIISHGLAPYGNSSEFDFPEMLQEKYLNCGNYPWLLAGIFKILKGVNYPGKMQVIGFDGGIIGNHAQLIYQSDNGTSLLFDPTVGIIARISYLNLINGIAIPEKNIISLYSYWTSTLQDPTLHSYHWKVYVALQLGNYRPQDALYIRDVSKEHFEYEY